VPFLRVIRDKRGYETTYLIHWYREGTRQRSRILYVFRTPGGVRVGREPFEPQVRHDIEILHPAIAFDWKAVMADRQVIETGPETRRPRRPRRSEAERSPAPVVAAAQPPGVEPAESPALAAPPLPPIPSTIKGSTPDERMAFLALWYPIVRDRIPQRTSDPTRQEALLALAERLSPAAWTDADEIAAGLQAAAESLGRLSRVFSRRRRRSKRTPSRPAGQGSTVSGVEPPHRPETPAEADPPRTAAVTQPEGE
jgi:hypothetical protein